MDALPPPDTDLAEDVFAGFLEQLEANEPGDFEALCAAHPALAPLLRRLYRRWQAVSGAFGELSTSFSRSGAQSGVSSGVSSGGSSAARSAAPPGTVPSAPPIDALMARLSANGARIARYAIGAEIARGAMGRVVTAWDEELRREVALKVHRGRAADARMQRRFLEEAQIAAQLDHPGIVPVHELGLDADGRPFFSMQLVRGRHLGEILMLAQRGVEGWSRTRVLHVLLRVCEAMAFAHSKGVVHRDLKPANVMVGRFGETYVMDWGLARVAGRAGASEGDDDIIHVDTLSAELAAEHDGSPLLTQQGDVVGTPAYMAPEQADGGRDVSPAVDVYAVGAILYHLLAGHAPYGERKGLGADAVLQRVRREPPTPLPAAATPELRAICERAMARTPADRYPTMMALADDLRAFLEVRTVRAYATGPFAELRKWVARNRALAASCLALLVALGAGAFAVTGLWLAAEQNRERADATTVRLQDALDRSAFRSARQALQLDDSIEAADTLWRAHFAGRMPRATSWALAELMERDPFLVALPIHDDDLVVAFAPAVRAALVGGADGRLQVRDADTLALRAQLGMPGAGIGSLGVLGGGRLAIAGKRNGELVVFDVERSTELRRVRAHAGSVRKVAVSSSAGFATGGADGKVLWWASHTAEPRVLLSRDHAISSLTVTPENDGVMAGDVDGVLAGVALNNSWRLQFRVGGNLTSLASGSRSNELWVGSTTHSLRFFDFVERARDFALPTRNGTCREIARDRDGSVFAGGWWRIDHVAEDGTVLAPAALRGISRFAFDGAARRLLVSGSTCGLGLVDVANGDRRTVPGSGLALSADGRRIATVVGGSVELRDVDSSEVLRRLDPPIWGSITLDATGSKLAVTRDREVHVFDVATGAESFTTDGPASDPFGAAVQFSPDGSEVAVCVGEDRVRRLASSDGRRLAEYAYPGRQTTRVVWSPDGARLAVIGRDDPIVHVFRVADGGCEPVAFDVLLPSGVSTSLSSVALSTDGRVAVGTWSGAILVREPDGGTTGIPAHGGTVWSVQFADWDPRLLVSSGGSSGVAFWDLDTEECCYRAVPSADGAVATSRDGRTLACQMTDGVLLLDLTYRQRHVAGNLDYQLARQRGRVALAPERERELRAWATDVLARPWPRWR